MHQQCAKFIPLLKCSLLQQKGTQMVPQPPYINNKTITIIHLKHLFHFHHKWIQLLFLDDKRKNSLVHSRKQNLS